MHSLQKLVICLIIILAFASVYHDLNSGSQVHLMNESDQQENSVQTKQFTVVKVKVEAGDTFLSIIEQLNDSLTTVNIDEISEDFMLINHTDPHDIKNGDSYYFPLYK